MSSSIVVLAAIMAGPLVFWGLRADRNAQLVLARQDELESQSRAFSELSSKAVLFGAEDSESFRQLTGIVSDAIHLRRTSVWHFDDDGQFLSCIDCCDQESNGHTQGPCLPGPSKLPTQPVERKLPGKPISICSRLKP
jgi:hypothetical protein